MEKLIIGTSEYKRILRSFLQIGVILILLYYLGVQNFFLFRYLIELFCFVIALGIFMVAWNSRKIIDNSFLLFVGLAYLYIGVLGVMRTITYTEMGFLLESSINVSQQLRLARLYLESFSFLVAILFLGREIKVRTVFLAYATIFVILVLSIFFWHNFPVAYDEITGESVFKRFSDFAVIIIFITSLVLLHRKLERFDPLVAQFLFLSLIFQIFSVFLHAPFLGGYSFGNYASQALRFSAAFFLYKSVLETGLMNPYRVIFRSLKNNEESLKKAHDELELKVQQRTIDLEKTNKELRREIAQRAKAENELIDSYKHLGQINRRISLLLEMNNYSLKKRKKEALSYILSSAVRISHADYGVIYFRSNNNFYSVLAIGLSREQEKKIKLVNYACCRFVDKLVREKLLMMGISKEMSLGTLQEEIPMEYCMALPLLVSKKLQGFIFLGFHEQKDLDNPEAEFFNVFASNAASTLFNAGILR